MKPLNTSTPSCCRPWKPESPTTAPVEIVMKAMTPTVPPMIASAPLPRLTSASSRMISL